MESKISKYKIFENISAHTFTSNEIKIAFKIYIDAVSELSESMYYENILVSFLMFGKHPNHHKIYEDNKAKLIYSIIDIFLNNDIGPKESQYDILSSEMFDYIIMRLSSLDKNKLYGSMVDYLEKVGMDFLNRMVDISTEAMKVSMVHLLNILRDKYQTDKKYSYLGQIKEVHIWDNSIAFTNTRILKGNEIFNDVSYAITPFFFNKEMNDTLDEKEENNRFIFTILYSLMVNIGPYDNIFQFKNCLIDLDYFRGFINKYFNATTLIGSENSALIYSNGYREAYSFNNTNKQSILIDSKSYPINPIPLFIYYNKEYHHVEDQYIDIVDELRYIAYHDIKKYISNDKIKDMADSFYNATKKKNGAVKQWYVWELAMVLYTIGVDIIYLFIKDNTDSFTYNQQKYQKKFMIPVGQSDQHLYWCITNIKYDIKANGDQNDYNFESIISDDNRYRTTIKTYYDLELKKVYEDSDDIVFQRYNIISYKSCVIGPTVEDTEVGKAVNYHMDSDNIVNSINIRHNEMMSYAQEIVNEAEEVLRSALKIDLSGIYSKIHEFFEHLIDAINSKVSELKYPQIYFSNDPNLLSTELKYYYNIDKFEKFNYVFGLVGDKLTVDGIPMKDEEANKSCEAVTQRWKIRCSSTKKT